MIRKASDMEQEVRPGLRGGAGEVGMTHLFRASELSGKAKLCAKLTLAPGCSIGEHSHDEDGELFIILSGTGTVQDNGETYQVTAGDAVWTADGAFHALFNRSQEPLELYAIVMQ